MKSKLFILIATVGLLIASCSLVEEPPFLSNESAYASLANAQSTLDGVYNALSEYNNFGMFYHYMIDGSSGFFVSGKGNRNTHADNLNLCSLNPLPGAVHNEGLWGAIYKTIGRTNDMISSMTAVEPAVATADELGMNDVIGNAYFIRAYSYFLLVRLWGDVPIRLTPTTTENVHLGKTSSKEVYHQVIKDAEMAVSLMYGKTSQRPGYPANLAANMLLAKVYMTLATAPVELQDAGSDYWTLAYDEAKKVYGQYALVNDYESMWIEETSENTSESIFEVQFNEIQASNFVRLWTGSNGTTGPTWGRLKINPECIDLHTAKYPTDSRIAGTFISTYTKYNKNTGNSSGLQKSYPDVARNNFKAGYPYLYKYWQKTPISTTFNNQNFVVYRYADVLLMLAEISNELNNGEQLDYVTEVLDRVGLTPHTDYNGGQDNFRSAIMREYQFELLGEGQDWFTNRRRGYTYFRDNVILPHNTAPTFDSKVDVTLLDNDESVMHLPFPSSEINTNQEINN